MKNTYSVSEAAKLLGYSTNSVYSFLKHGEIKATRLGKGKFRIPKSEIDRLLSAVPKEETQPVKVLVTPAIETSYRMIPPKPGRSLADLSSDQPLKTVILWFQERAGLPKLFDWFVAISSVVLGVSLFLYTKQLDSLLIGRYAIWFTPIIIALLAGGVGLILADMLREESPLYKNFNNIFRYVLVVTYLGFAFLHLPSRDVDGFLINGLFAIVILIEALFGVLSSTAYMFYLQGLLIGMTLILSFYHGDTGLSEMATIVQKTVGGSPWIFGLLSFVIVTLTLFGYFWNKKVLKVVLGVSGVAMIALSVYYANAGYYGRSFFILITGMVGLLLPFWEQFKRRYEADRTLVYRMFGTVLMTFSLAVLIIGSVQSILITNGTKNLAQKADFVRISVEKEVADAISTLEGVSQNSVFVKAVSANNKNDLDSFSKVVFKNNSSFNNVVVTNEFGDVLAMYPVSTELDGINFSKETFFINALGGEEAYVSARVEYFAPDMEKAIIVAIPINDSQNGRTLGVAMVTLSAEYLSDVMQTIAEDTAGQVITVVDADGKWIVYPETEVIGATVSEADATLDLWKRGEGEVRGYDRQGHYSLFVSRKSEVLDWTVVVSQPMATALDVSRSGLVLVLFLLMAASLTVVFSYVFSKNRNLLDGQRV